MRAQTSIEFMMVSGAIAAFSLFAIGVFTNVIHGQHLLFSNAINTTTATVHITQNTVNSSGYSVYSYLSLPSVSYLNRSNNAYVVVSAPKGSMIQNVSITGNNESVLPTSYRNASSFGISEFSFTFVPKMVGAVMMKAIVTASYLNKTVNSVASGVTYVGQLPQSALNQTQQGAYATITRINESVLYAPAGYSNIYTVTEYHHCSWYDFWGRQIPVRAQCNMPGWGYWTPSGRCPWSATYCISLSPTGSSASPIQNAYSYIYNISLGLYGQGISMVANLTNSKDNARLIGQDGKATGNASVSSANGQAPQPYYDYAILNASNTIRLINLTAYNAYLQSLGSLQSRLSFYNGTPIDADTQALINQSIGTFETASSRLIGSQQSTSGTCATKEVANTTEVVCKPLSIFYYTINATIDQKIYGSSQVISMQGSTISVR